MQLLLSFLVTWHLTTLFVWSSWCRRLDCAMHIIVWIRGMIVTLVWMCCGLLGESHTSLSLEKEYQKLCRRRIISNLSWREFGFVGGSFTTLISPYTVSLYIVDHSIYDSPHQFRLPKMTIAKFIQNVWKCGLMDEKLFKRMNFPTVFMHSQYMVKSM